MPEPYGVVDTGFNPKTLAEILADIETGMVAIFGEGVVQDPQSVLGQLNGMYAGIVAESWELAHQVYVSHDPDEVDGPRLEMIGSITAKTRGADIPYSVFRKTITRPTELSPRAFAVLTAVQAISGVTWLSVNENSTHAYDFAGIPPHTLAVSVIGGDDAEIAEAIYRKTANGIGLYGRTSVEVTIDGYARQVLFTRPDDILMAIELDISPLDHSASVSEITESVIASAYEDWSNGHTISPDLLQSYIGKVGGLALKEARIARVGEEPIVQTVDMEFSERPVLISGNVVVRLV